MPTVRAFSRARYFTPSAFVAPTRMILGPGQRKLKASKVGIVGAGAIGSAGIPSLAGAGIGRLTVIDDDPLSPASADELAKHAETITYEVLCRIGPRVKRVAIDPEDHVDRAAQTGRDGAAGRDWSE